MTKPNYSRPDLLAVHRVRCRVASWRKGVITVHELVCAVVQDLVLEGGDAAIPDCVAILPPAALDDLKRYIRELAASGYRGRVYFIGPGLSDAEQEALQPRFRTVGERLAECLAEIEKHPELAAVGDVPEVDLYWSYLQATPADGAPPCERPGCGEPKTQFSQLCASHHYEWVKGTPPPKPRE
jgi:hypothetical protein